ncbi:MAG TPA: filamentous hemagglutinin N-terminal domain-containing protein, partial [Candidatus Methylacidiphilales bacterium]
MNTHRHGDRFGTFQRRWLRSIAPALLLILAPTALLANPTGGSVVAGSATITTSGSTLNVNTGSAQTIINWQDFGIAAGEITNINQPNSSSTTLNRVLGGNVSEIYGTLNSNGNVILVNPNGVLVGAGGVVNTQGSFLASTLNLSDSDFLSGNYHLTGNSTASVTNLGQITSGGKDIFLIAQHVSNSGSLTAHNGTVGLAAGNDVSIAQSGDQRLSVALDSATVARNGTGIDNQGTIEAVKAELVANGNIYSLAVNNGGIVRATGAGNVGGQVWLLGHGGTVKNTGTIVASNADGTGGAIETSGDDVSIAGVVQTGAGGSWLIDPATLIIDAGAASTLATALDGGTNVTQQATSVVELDSALAWSGAGVLTLDAGTGSIVFNASLTSSGSGGLAFVYGSGYTLNSGAAINLSTASSLTINGQAYTVLGDVASLVAAVNGNAAGYYALGSNATASGTYTASAIASLSGAIDGLGHAIGGFTLSASSGTAIGFVGTNTGTIRNLALSNVSVTFADSLAGSSAYIGGLVGYSTGTLSGVSVSGTLSVSASNSTTTPYVLPRVGGLAGYSSGTVSNASASASISVSGSSRGVSMMVA